MNIIGNGFLAGHFRTYFGSRQLGATIVAAGASTTVADNQADFDREANLIYDIARRCRAGGSTLVLLSTAAPAMYGSADSPCAEDGPVYPPTPYGRHKLALERVCALSGAPWLVLRLTNIVGPGQPPGQLLPTLTRHVLAGEVTVHRGAHRDLFDVRQLPPVLDSLLTRKVTGEVVNIATGNPVEVENVVQGIERRLGRTAQRNYVSRPADRVLVDVTKVRRLVPEFAELNFAEGYLDAMLDHYFKDSRQEFLAPGP
ncbi:NAD-dependent epimerase/dehydratase family protein [Prauserella cavernicola]|uniref:NAD-dependent epimerase/dehydratase family protein n=1 Tax=Prauserella cavernicola TaxID=2800127 RepID=A0A934V6D1_9PSEU|nr:NAD-dependent epimerase/dehydratase family protein [Prauserella cavernicola]MBK1786594.1 NAD-dependent epimerase/dehydratase family protein [Prauserella cavernicola]